MTDTNGHDDGVKPAHRRGRGKSDHYLTPVDENNIVATLLAARRWKSTDEHKQVALGITTKNMGNEDARVSNAAVSNLIKMEAQNQADEHKLLPDKHQLELTIGERARLVEDEDWYGTADTIDERRDADAPEAASPSKNGAD